MYTRATWSKTVVARIDAAVLESRTPAWMSNYGEPLVRFCTVPILLVPELNEGASR